MAPDIERHSMELLEWLYDHPEDDGGAFPVDSSSNDDLYDLVRFLADRYLVKDVSTFGGARADICPDGTAAVQRLRARRADPAQRAHRARMVRTHLLWWLDSQDTAPANWSGALIGLGVDDLGTPFTMQDISREAAYLMDKGLISGHRPWGSDDLLRPALTHAGRTCITDFGGNVSDYLNPAHRGGNTTNNHVNVSGASNNIALGDHNTQTMTTGLDTAKVLEFAQFVSQAMPALGLPDDQQDALETQVQELQQEADSLAADPGRIRGLINRIMTGLGAATSEAIQTVAIGMGEQALESVQAGITGG